MKSLRVHQTANGPSLQSEETMRPELGPYQLLVRVLAAGVTSGELQWYPTTHDKAGGGRDCAVPGHEFSGVVAAVGPGVGSLEVGREVFGLNDWFDEGAMAEYCIATLDGIAPKPQQITHIEAASVPIAALTSWQGLRDRAALKCGERVLIHGAGGAVGVCAVQLAKLWDAHVVATASAEQLQAVRELGADEVLDYRAGRFEDQMAKVDVVFDTVGGQTLQRSWNVLNPGGRVLTIAADGESTSDARVREAFFIVERNQKQLSLIADLLASGRLRPIVRSVMPLARAASAFQSPAPGPHAPGKIVIAVPN